jgi:hypothetical protein
MNKKTFECKSRDTVPFKQEEILLQLSSQKFGQMATLPQKNSRCYLKKTAELSGSDGNGDLVKFVDRQAQEAPQK